MNICEATQSPETIASPEAVQPPVIIARAVPIWKRALDIVLSLVVGIVLSPVLVFIAIFIKCVSKGPVLYRQDRLGHGGEYFSICKFRTLEINAAAPHRDYIKSMERSEPAVKPKLDSFLITGGNFLRASSLDELPQLINVLRGEMSLVGPRPDVLHIEDYEERDLRRFEVLPGITGLWQVSGKNRLSQDEMIDLDVQYVDKVSPKLDLLIIIRTFWVLLRQDNN